MRITQGYVSKSVSDFPFHQIYSLDDYNERKEPAVFFGMYRYEDFVLADSHQGDVVVFWTGQDALHAKHWPKLIGKNVTAHKRVYDRFTELGIKIQLVKPSTFLNSVNPQKLGPTIYAYCPNSAPDYHGKKVLDELRTAGYEIVIGDGATPQHLWKHTCDAFYNDIFIGLCLSDFAGGGTSIIEMGLRGIRVITNVFDLPHCLPWHDAQEVAKIIEQEKTLIGTTNRQLAQNVWESLDHDHEWLQI